MTHKYSVGTILICLIDDEPFEKGKKYKIVPSLNYPDSYAFEGIRNDGWITEYVETEEYFIKSINNWREIIQ